MKKFLNKKVIDDFFNTFKEHGYNIEFNNHHDAKSLKDTGISDKEWVKTNPEIHNFAIFCYPEKYPNDIN